MLGEGQGEKLYCIIAGSAVSYIIAPSSLAGRGLGGGVLVPYSTDNCYKLI